MKNNDAIQSTSKRKPRGMSEERRRRLRLDISREATRLFWEKGVANTTGEEIAEAAGVSVRTLWRHFRNKESCAEPLLSHTAEEFVAVLRRWPRELSLEDHLAAWSKGRSRDPDQQADRLAAVRMTVLAQKEPDLRAAWLMANDRIERELVGIVANRLPRSTDDLDVRLHAATTTAVLRVISEDVNAALVAGTDPMDNPIRRLARAVRVATGGALGDPVGP